MTIAYVNTNAQAALAAHPRAVYRVTLQRAGVTQLSFMSGVIKWPDIVEQVVSAAGYSPYGVPLGYSPPGVQDLTAVVEIRAESTEANPGSISASVGDLARVMDTATVAARVARIERLSPVPPKGSVEERTRAETMARTQEEAAEAAKSSGVFATIQRGLTRVGIVGTVAVALGAAFGVLYLARQAGIGSGARNIGQADEWL